MPAVSILGSSTLDRFSIGILQEGFKKCGWKIASDSERTGFVLVQIHGSMAAREQDLKIINQIHKIAEDSLAVIVLLHRPDEIRDNLPQIRDVFQQLPKVGIVMLGNLIAQDPFYSNLKLPIRIIPHGFFDLTECLSDSIIIGSHTTWGEMRRIDQAIDLIISIFDQDSDTQVVGYLGGYPKTELNLENLRKIIKSKILSTQEIPHLELINYDSWREQIRLTKPSTILICPGEAPVGFDLTFNFQLYHYNGAVRLGESSGSLHASQGIPVIFEMNGSEILEDLIAVKVPYTNLQDVESANLKQAGKEIAQMISNHQYLSVLKHNKSSRQRWSNQVVATKYIDFFVNLELNKNAF